MMFCGGGQFVKKEEVHNIVEEQQSNICQIAVFKDNILVYSDTWNNYKATDNVHIAKDIFEMLIST